MKGRLADFARAHRKYVVAQRAVEAAEAKLRAAQTRVTQRDGAQDAAVEALARALVADGLSRRNPFEPFGAAAPGTLTRLAFAEEAQAIHELAAAVQRRPESSKSTRHAAEAADKAARAVEAALAALPNLQEAVRSARHTRDALGKDWETALTALKYAARAAVGDGAPKLYATLFPPVVRGGVKKAEEESPETDNGTEAPAAADAAAAPEPPPGTPTAA